MAIYKKMIAFGGAFGTGGYAPAFITDWLDARLQQGQIADSDGILNFTASAAQQLIGRLNAVVVTCCTFGDDHERKYLVFYISQHVWR